jgi:hypothetical protein
VLNHSTPRGPFMVLKSSGNISSINIQLFYIGEKCKRTGRMRVTCVLSFRTWVSNLVTAKGHKPYCAQVRGPYVEK